MNYQTDLQPTLSPLPRHPSSFAGDQIDIAALFNIDAYPIHSLAGARREEMVTHARAQLDADGCVVLRNFVTRRAVQAMEAEAHRLMSKRCTQSNMVNPYFTTDDPTLDDRHPRRFFEVKSSSFINSDELEAVSPLRQIYDSDVLIKFLSDCLGVAPIFRWADPLARCPYSVMDEDDYFPWHFDGNDFTVSILVSGCESGGVFEYCPGIRSDKDENTDAVSEVLLGDRTRVKELPLQVGDLQLFKGRYSLHRVTQVSGQKPRIIALPTYVTDPFLVNKPTHSEILYGRSLPIHHERQHFEHVDRLMD